jgi:hypothetical protein
MARLTLKAAGATVVLAVAFGSAAVWGLGSPTEAYAIVRLDGIEAIPWTPLGLGTCYAPAFTHAGFLAIRPGDSFAAVRDRIGEPLEIVWSDPASDRGIEFRPRGGRYVVTWTNGVDVATGSAMESVDPGRVQLRKVFWIYARQCTQLDSNRIRVVSFEADRVTERHSGVYYD